MNIEEFKDALLSLQTDEDIRKFCQENLFEGVPHCFAGEPDLWLTFKKGIAEQFAAEHTDVYVVGSAKLGFSPHKLTLFSVESDIDVALVSTSIFCSVGNLCCQLEYQMRDFQLHLPRYVFTAYLSFLRYMAIGWIRPDKAPIKGPLGDWKQLWFEYFRDISYENCLAGNYKVNAGIFRTHEHLIQYSASSFRKVRQNLDAELVA